MKCWGFTPQKPAKMVYERNPKAVQKWLNEDYPFIKKRAKLIGGQVYWGDEMGFRNDCQHSRGYAPKEKTPVMTVTAKCFLSNMISAINNRGTIRFFIYIAIAFWSRAFSTQELYVAGGGVTPLANGMATAAD